MNHPNWKTAPARATHYQPERDDSGMFVPVYWRIDDHGVPVEAWSVQSDGLYHIPNPSHTSDLFDGRLVPRPTEPASPTLDGQGLPPTGLEVEWLECAQTGWQRVTVLAYHDNDAWIAPAGRPSIIVGNPANFRPIRTPDQIEAEERNTRIADLANAIQEAGWESPEMLAAYLESHGYRKQPK